jgi:hypothetical protein
MYLLGGHNSIHNNTFTHQLSELVKDFARHLTKPKALKRLTEMTNHMIQGSKK